MIRYILRRLLLMIPTLIAISMVSFFIIQLPPGDYLSMYVAELEAEGVTVEREDLENLRQQYGLGRVE